MTEKPVLHSFGPLITTWLVLAPAAPPNQALRRRCETRPTSSYLETDCCRRFMTPARAASPRSRVENQSMAVTQQRQADTEPHDGLKFVRLCFYHVYIACTLGLSTVLLIPRSQSGAVAGGGAIFQASWVFLLGLTVVTLITIRRHFGPNFFFAFMMCAYVTSSAIWSVNPSSTLTYGALFAGNILVAYAITTEYSIDQIIRYISRIILVLTVLGLAAYAARLSFTFYFDHQSRANLLGIQPLRGLFPHKITGGLYAVMGAILALKLYRGPLRLAAVSLYALFVILSGSASALILGCTAMLIYFVVNFAVRRKIRSGMFALLFGTAACVTSITVYLNQSSILDLLGRDSTLTGRTSLWQYGLDEWQKHPILGWGFNGYFSSDYAQYLRHISAFQNYNVPHFHQSYIQTMVDLGLVGLILLVIMLSYILYFSYKWALQDTSGAGCATFTLASSIAVAGFAIFVVFEYNHFATVILFIMYFGLRRRFAKQPNNSSATHMLTRIGQK